MNNGIQVKKEISLYDFKQNAWHFRNAKQKKKNLAEIETKQFSRISQNYC